MKNIILPIKAEIDYLNKNEHQIYCVGNWVQTRIEGEMTPVRITSIRHDGATVSTSPYFDGSILSVEKILSNLYNLLSESKGHYSTRPALCAQYAALIIEVDYAIVRLNIDKNIIKSAISVRLPVDYDAWAEKIKEAAKNWGYKGFRETDDACYFDPGFDYNQFIDDHETYWQALQDKLDALVKILKEIGTYTNGNKDRSGRQDKEDLIPISSENTGELYISYPWKMMNEIDGMCRVLDDEGLPYKRDVKDCAYRQSIRQFEEEIGNGAKVLAFINDDYLKSINCMYELARVFQRGEVDKRLYPVVSISGQRGSEMLRELYDYWDNEYQERKNLLNNLPSGVSLQVIDELSYCDTIIRELTKIVNYLTQVNTLSYDELRNNRYDRLVKELRR